MPSSREFLSESARIWPEVTNQAIPKGTFSRFHLRRNRKTGEVWATFKATELRERRSFNLHQTGLQIEYIYNPHHPLPLTERYRFWPIILILREGSVITCVSFRQWRKESPIVKATPPVLTETGLNFEN